MLAARLELVAPGKRFLHEASAGGELPFRFGGQTLARPFRVSIGIVPRNLHNRVLPTPFDIGAWSFGMTPSRALNPAPPLASQDPPAHKRRLLCGGKMSDENKPPSETLRVGFITRRVHEFVKLLVRNTCDVDIKRCDLDSVR